VLRIHKIPSVVTSSACRSFKYS